MKMANLTFVRRLAMVAILAIVVAFSWWGPLDAAAKQQTEAGLERALLSFASARALNAIISAVQGTEVAVEPGGVGVVFTPGEVLDPINDLVEQFSNLMLAASVSFGVQKVLISIGAYSPIRVLLTLAAIGWAVLHLRAQSAPDWLSRILVVLLMIRFAVPVVAIGSDRVFQEFMAADYSASKRAIDATSHELSNLNSAAVPNNGSQGVVEKIRGWWSQNSDVKLRFEHLKQAAEDATQNIVRIIVIFLLQTLVIPLVLLWVLYGVTRRAFQTGSVA